MDERAAGLNGHGRNGANGAALAPAESGRAVARRTPGREADRLQEDIQRIRGNLGALVDELDARRRRAMDVRLQIRLHPVAAAVVSVALLGLVGGAIALGVARRRRRRAPVARLHRLRLALRRLVDEPERLAGEERPQPSVGRKIAAAGGSAAAGVLARRLAQRLVHE